MHKHTYSSSSDELRGFSYFQEIAMRIVNNSEHANQGTYNSKTSDTNKETENNQPNQTQNQKLNIEYLQ